MPFEPISPVGSKYVIPKPCQDKEHNPPTHIVIRKACVWVCPACGERFVINPPRVTM